MQFSPMSGDGSEQEGRSMEEDVERWQRLAQPPDNEVPVALALTAVLWRTESLAVVLTAVQACSTGFGFQVSLRLRQPEAPGRDVYGQFMGNAGAGGQFLLGVEFTDGRRGSTLSDAAGATWGPARPGLQGEGQEVLLSGGGGGGGGRRFDHTWWVSPLPPEGPLRFVVRWDAQGLEESMTQVDGTAVLHAGRSAEQLWPWEPENPVQFEAEEGQRPASGWFSRP